MYNSRISGNIICHKLSKPPFLSVSCQFNGFPGQESEIYKEGKSSSSQHHCWRVITGSQMMMMMRTRNERTGDRVAHHERTKEKISINRMEWKIAQVNHSAALERSGPVAKGVSDKPVRLSGRCHRHLRRLPYLLEYPFHGHCSRYIISPTLLSSACGWIIVIMIQVSRRDLYVRPRQTEEGVQLVLNETTTAMSSRMNGGWKNALTQKGRMIGKCWMDGKEDGLEMERNWRFTDRQDKSWDTHNGRAQQPSIHLRSFLVFSWAAADEGFAG